MKTGIELAEYAFSKIGTPYFYGAKMHKLTEDFMQRMKTNYPSMVGDNYIAKARKKGSVGKICVDCSGLIGAYRGKQIGSAQLYSSASKRLKMDDLECFPIGTVLWKKGHVGVYIGKEKGVPMCVEAKGIDYGTILSKVSATKWSYGLLFDDMQYSGNVLDGTFKQNNPFVTPTSNVKRGDKGTSVRWVQFELVEAGYKLNIDGIFGAITEKYVREFQHSAKLEVDGIVGKNTRKALLAN